MSTQLAETSEEIEDGTIERFILDELEGRPLVVSTDTEATRYLTLEGVSNSRMTRRLGSMIKRGMVLRCRRHMESMNDDDRPITYMLNPNYVQT